LLLHTNNEIDIAVIEPTSAIFNSSGITTDPGADTILGDSGIFLGFPLGISSSPTNDSNFAFPLPLVKGLLYSGVYENKGAILQYFDGHNNPGFSGGPILFRNRKINKPDNWYLVAIVRGYVPQTNKMKTHAGTYDYPENSSIMIGYSASHVGEIIERG